MKKSVLAAVGATVVAAGATIVAAKKRCNNNNSDIEETGIYGREKDYTVISLSELLEATKKR